MGKSVASYFAAQFLSSSFSRSHKFGSSGDEQQRKAGGRSSTVAEMTY